MSLKLLLYIRSLPANLKKKMLPSVFCLIAHTPDMILSLARVLIQKLPRKGQFFLEAVIRAALDLSVDAYPKNSAIYPAISIVFYYVMKTFTYSLGE